MSSLFLGSFIVLAGSWCADLGCWSGCCKPGKLVALPLLSAYLLLARIAPLTGLVGGYGCGVFENESPLLRLLRLVSTAPLLMWNKMKDEVCPQGSNNGLASPLVPTASQRRAILDGGKISNLRNMGLSCETAMFGLTDVRALNGSVNGLSRSAFTYSVLRVFSEPSCLSGVLPSRPLVLDRDSLFRGLSLTLEGQFTAAESALRL